MRVADPDGELEAFAAHAGQEADVRAACLRGRAGPSEAVGRTYGAPGGQAWFLSEGLQALPGPRSREVIRKDPDVARDLADGAALVIVPLVMETGRPVKANLSLDAGLLAAIDEAAAARGLTRSAFLSSAARDKIRAEG